VCICSHYLAFGLSIQVVRSLFQGAHRPGEQASSEKTLVNLVKVHKDTLPTIDHRSTAARTKVIKSTLTTARSNMKWRARPAAASASEMR
jgi:hypothetical protein